MSNSFQLDLERAQVQTHPIQLNDSSFDRWIRELKPDYVVFDRFMTEEQFGWRVQEQCPEAVRVLDTVDLHFLRRARETALKTGAPLQLTTEDTLREIASLHRCDTTFLISDYELELLIQRFSISPPLLFLSRFHYPEPPTPKPFENREGFAIIGNFRHKPNSDGVLWFRAQIWPEIRTQLPTAQVYVYGAYPSKQMMDLHKPSLGFHLMGSTPDQFQTLSNHRVSLAPLRFGAGIKGKISDSWWTGAPVVTTRIGAEGMHDSNPWPGAISDDPQEFATQAVQLYTDSTRWQKAQQDCLEVIRNLYLASRHSRPLVEHLVQVRENLVQLREQNWIGQMLHLHIHRSTQYFSRWIEAKSQVVPVKTL